MRLSVAKWFDSGSPWVWLSAACVAISTYMVASLVLLLAVRGFGHFWPSAVADFNAGGTRVIGELIESEDVLTAKLKKQAIAEVGNDEFTRRWLVKIGNRDLDGVDFRWFYNLGELKYPADVFVLERREWGNFYGFFRSFGDKRGSVGQNRGIQAFLAALEKTRGLYEEIKRIEKVDIGRINFELEGLRLETRRLELKGRLAAAKQTEIDQTRSKLNQEYNHLNERLQQLYTQVAGGVVEMQVSDGSLVSVPLKNIVRAYRPNRMSLLDRIGFYFEKLAEFITDDPREANTEGGIFPAIFGTVLMVLVMSFLATPFGVIAAVYLREYAKQGILTRLIRIAVNNLAGVPSIVYGIFGLGFFVYFLGGNIDQLFFPESLPAPVYGTPGLLWASITLAILTLPVVIVATEEGLARIPRAIREGSMALGATKAETLWRTVIPMASPAIMTGMILAIARAAGEVAPLMLVGVVKLAPSLPLDGNFPYLHLERKFMHLGFHIYDVGFQSPNVEAARPLVYATAFLLVVVILVLNLAAIAVRNHLRERNRALET